MKKILFVSFLLLEQVLLAQNVGIGTATPNTSAKLDIVDANRGILLPRVALTSTTVAAPVASPANWLVVFNTQNINDVTEGMYYWNGTRWVRLSTSRDAWQLLGNAGTNSTTNFIGTTDATDLVFRTTNVERMRILANGNVGIGTAAPTKNLEIAGQAVRITYSNPFLDFNGTFAPMPNLATLGIRSAGEMVLRTNTNNNAVADWEVKSGQGTNAFPNDCYYIGRRANPTIANPDYFFFVGNTGNVGVGTTSPSTLIATRAGSMVLGQGNPDYAELTGGAGFGANLALRWATNGNINSFVSGNNSSYLNVQTGNVGVGIAAPIEKFQVGNGNARIGEINPVNGASTYPNTGRALYFSGGQGNSWDSENSDPIMIQRYNVASDQTDLQIIIGDNTVANNDRLTIGNLATGQRIALSASGHVGINTLSPAANLDIVGNMKLTDGTQGAYKKLTSDAAGVARWEAAPSDVTANDVNLALGSGTATNLYTTNQVLAKGTYLVYFYNCIAASSTNYYISAGPELLSGAATINQPFVWDWSQNRYYTTVPSVLKIQSATATVRGRVRHETGGTVTENAASCSNFHFVRIGD